MRRIQSLSMASFVLLLSLVFCSVSTIFAIETTDLDHAPQCTCDQDGKPCEVDGYVGSSVLYEDEDVRIWNFTLPPGEMTSMHKHDYDYHFVIIQPSQLEIWGEDGSRLLDFRGEGVLGFKVAGDFLEPIGIELPSPVPRVHAAKNIGPDTFYEILFESKKGLKVEQSLDGANKDEL